MGVLKQGCRKCCEGEAGRTVADKLICVVCGRYVPIAELVEDVCNQCYEKYRNPLDSKDPEQRDK